MYQTIYGANDRTGELYKDAHSTMIKKGTEKIDINPAKGVKLMFQLEIHIELLPGFIIIKIRGLIHH